MADIVFKAIPTAEAWYFQRCGTDTYRLLPEWRIFKGDGVLCRHSFAGMTGGDRIEGSQLRATRDMK